MATRVESILNPFQGVRADMAPLEQATLALGSLFREKLGLDGKGLQKLDMHVALSDRPIITLTGAAFIDGDWRVVGTQVIEQDGAWKAAGASPDTERTLQETSAALLDAASKVQKVVDPVEQILAEKTPVIVQKIRELKDQIAQLTKENARLQSSVESSQQEVEAYQRALKALKASLFQLKAEVAAFREEYGKQGRVVTQFGADIEQLREANQILQDRLALLTAEREQHLRRIADLEAQNRELQEALDSLPPPVDLSDNLAQMHDRLRPIADRLTVLAQAGWDFDERTYLNTVISNLSCLNANGFDERELTTQVQTLYPVFITEPMADRRNLAAIPVKACLKHIHDYPQDVFEKDRKAFGTFAGTIRVMNRVGINRMNAQTIERNDHFFQLGGEFTTAHLMTTFPNIAGNLMALESRLKETYRLYCELQGKSVDNDTEMDRIHLHIRRVHQLMTVVRSMKGSVKAILENSKKR
jgi:phage shock protein A